MARNELYSAAGHLDFRICCNFSPGFSLFSIWTRRSETASPEWEFAALFWLAGSAARVVRFDCFACRFQREGERLLGDVGHKRSDHPAKPRGNVPGQRSHFTLDVNAAVALFHAPPRFHPPHESV